MANTEQQLEKPIILAKNTMSYLFNPNTKVPATVNKVLWLVLGTIALAFSVPMPIWS